MSNRQGAKAPPTAPGRGALISVVFLFAIGGVLAWLWLGTSSRSGRNGAPLVPEVAPPPPTRPATSALDTAVPALRAEPALREEELAPFSAHPGPNPRFAGKFGSLRGHIDVTGEQPFPNRWRLVARPSRTMPERESAVERSQEFLDARQEFELQNLPLGGYDVWGEADGFNGELLPLLLEPGNEHPYLSLRLIPAGSLEGRVLDAEGLGAAGVTLTLFAVSDNAAREALTDGAGFYRFDALPDGGYEILVGKATAALIAERRPLRFQAPHLTFPDIELPPLGSIRVRVVDSLERPLEGIEIVGSGTNGGIVEGRTDYNGTLVAKHLPAGHFRLRLSHAGIGEQYTRRIAVDVVVGQVAQAPVRFGP